MEESAEGEPAVYYLADFNLINSNLWRSQVKTKKVIVLPYDKTWKIAFEEIKKEIEGAIGDLVIGIEHVGSTSFVKQI